MGRIGARVRGNTPVHRLGNRGLGKPGRGNVLRSPVVEASPVVEEVEDAPPPPKATKKKKKKKVSKKG